MFWLTVWRGRGQTIRGPKIAFFWVLGSLLTAWRGPMDKALAPGSLKTIKTLLKKGFPARAVLMVGKVFSPDLALNSAAFTVLPILALFWLLGPGTEKA